MRGPLTFPIIESFPRAAHWTEWTYEPALNPTAGLVGLLYQLAVDHPWMQRAARYCWEQIEGGRLDNAHTLSEALVFLEHVPEHERADDCAEEIAGHLDEVSLLHLDPTTPGYGLSPLHFAPVATRNGAGSSPIPDSSLDHLARSQQADGGWPITWEPPSEAARLEWRGVVTLQALRTLTSYGLMTADSDRSGASRSASRQSSAERRQYLLAKQAQLCHVERVTDGDHPWEMPIFV